MKKSIFFLLFLVFAISFSSSLVQAQTNIQFDCQPPVTENNNPVTYCDGMRNPNLPFNNTVPTISLNFGQQQITVLEKELRRESGGTIPLKTVHQSPFTVSYQPEQHLPNENFSLRVVARNNIWHFMVLNITFSINATGMDLWVISPENEYIERPKFIYSPEDPFFVELALEREATCKYTPRALGNRFLSHIFNLQETGQVFNFTSNHSDNEFRVFAENFSISEIVSGYTPGQIPSNPLQVICKETDTEQFIVGVFEYAHFPNSPTITIKADPDLVTDGVNGFSVFNVTTNQEAFCWFDNVEYPDNNSFYKINFERDLDYLYENESQFSKEFLEPVDIRAPVGEQNFLVNVTCVNKAGLYNSRTFTLNTDISQVTELRLLEPTRFNNQTTLSITLGNTDTTDTCFYSVNSEDIDEPLTRTTRFSQGRLIYEANHTFEQGNHTVRATCASTFTEVSRNIIVDTTPPGAPDIDVHTHTCSLSSVPISFSAEDNEGGSGIDSFEYELHIPNNDSFQNVTGTRRGSSVNVNFNGELFENQTLAIRARAIDKAGNIGSWSSQNMLISSQDIVQCDFTPPQIIINETQNPQTKHWSIMVGCEDFRSGCESSFGFSLHENLSEQCTYSQTRALNSTVEITSPSRLCVLVRDLNNNNATFSKNYKIDYPLHCSDGIRNEDETDVDCGGSCPVCELGSACQANTDCDSNYCLAGICTEATCTDGILNQDETDVDCGGSSCPACEIGNACLSNTDCQSLNCEDNICAEPSCTNNKQDGDQTDVDCGGSLCPACELGKKCLLTSDCAEGICTNGTCSLEGSSEEQEQTKEGFSLKLLFNILGFLLIVIGVSLLYFRRYITGANLPDLNESNTDDYSDANNAKQEEKEESPEIKALRLKKAKEAQAKREMMRKNFFKEFGEEKEDSKEDNSEKESDKKIKEEESKSEPVGDKSKDTKTKDPDKKPEKDVKKVREMLDKFEDEELGEDVLKTDDEVFERLKKVNKKK